MGSITSSTVAIYIYYKWGHFLSEFLNVKSKKVNLDKKLYY